MSRNSLLKDTKKYAIVFFFCYFRVMLSLSSSGLGGNPVLSYITPGHEWLLKIFQESSSSPMASNIMQSIAFDASNNVFQINKQIENIPGELSVFGIKKEQI